MIEGRRRGDGVLLLLSAAQTAPLLLLLLRPLRLLLCRDEACRRARARAEAGINPRAAVRGSCVSSEQLRGVQTPLAAHSAHARTHTSVARPRCARARARSFQRAPAPACLAGGGGGGHPLLCHLPSPTTRTPRHCASTAARYGSGKGQGASLQPPHWARADTGAKRRAAARRVPFRDCAPALWKVRAAHVGASSPRGAERCGVGWGWRGKGRVGKHTRMHTHVGSQSHTHACARAHAVRSCGRARAKPLC